MTQYNDQVITNVEFDINFFPFKNENSSKQASQRIFIVAHSDKLTGDQFGQFSVRKVKCENFFISRMLRVGKRGRRLLDV